MVPPDPIVIGSSLPTQGLSHAAASILRNELLVAWQTSSMMPDRNIDRADLRMQGFAVLAALVFSLILVTYPVFDFDLYWHLANGREMINSGRIISQEVFSYTHPGEEFANHEWLGQIIFYLIWSAYGAYGLLALKLLVVAAVVLLLYWTLRSVGTHPVLAALLCVLAVFAGINRFHERPELFTLLSMALLSCILYGFRSGQMARQWLLLLPVIIVAWDWLHGALYGLTFLTLFVAGENAKHRFQRLRSQQQLSIPELKYLNRTFLLTLLATVINPFGMRSYGIFVGYVFGQGNFNQVITEYMPVNWDEFSVFILLFAWTLLLAMRNWRSIDFTQLLLMVIFSLTALRFNRATGVAAIVLAPFLASLLGKGLSSSRGRLEHGFHLASLFAAGLLLTIQGYSVKFGAVEAEPDSDTFHYLRVYDLAFGYRMDESVFPVGAVNFIKEQKLKGHLYNSGNLGAYLSYRITPERKIFQYNISIFGDPFYFVLHPRDLAKWNIDYAIVDTESEMRTLFPQQDWAAVYHDEAAILMVRRTPQNENLIRTHESHYFNPAFSDANLLARARDPEVLPILAREIGDNLSYREDDRIAAVWTRILISHPELRRQSQIQQLLEKALRYNHLDKLMNLRGGSTRVMGE